MRCSSLLLAVLLAPGCLPDPPPGLPDASTDSASIAIVDRLGRPQDERATCRRPRILVAGTEPSDDPAAHPVLLVGEPDAAIVEDARRSPWTSATLSRSLRSRVVEGEVLAIEPESPLAPGVVVSVIVPSFLLGGAEPAEPLIRTFAVATVESGAILVESFPPDGSIGLGADLDSIDLGFDDDVFATESVELTDATGSIVPTSVAPIPCERTGLAASCCVRVTIAAELAAESSYSLDLARVRDRFGDPPRASPIGFRTTATPTSPTPLAIPCAIDERSESFGCVLEQDDRVSFRLRLANLARITITLSDRSVVTIPRGGEARLVVRDLSVDTSFDGSLRIEDASGVAEERPITVRSTPRLPDVVIGEIRADALGPEPAQEYVELWNLGETPIDLGGFRIADALDREGDLLPSPFVVPRLGVVLVVADGFDPAAGPDVLPPPGAMLARIGASIASSGLTNSGEPLFLRDAAGHRVTESPSVATPRAGICIARADTDYTHGAAGNYAPSATGCSPGTR